MPEREPANDGELPPARQVTVHYMTMGGRPYWEATGITAFLDGAAGNWAVMAARDDDVSMEQVARRLRQLSVQLNAEAIQQHDYWMTRGAPEPPSSSLPGRMKIRTAIKYIQGESHVCFNAVDLSAFLHAAADSSFLDDGSYDERLFDLPSAAGQASLYLHAIADQLSLETMLIPRAPGPCR